MKIDCKKLLALFVAAIFLSAAIPASAQEVVTPRPANQKASRILFIGNSFTFGAGSPVQRFHPQTVIDLNHEGIGGVPALFKAFTVRAGLDFAVNLETSPGKNLDFHVKNKASEIGQEWDYVVMQGFSILDAKKPGDPASLVESTKELVELLKSKNPKVDVRLVATWSRADQTYQKTGHWYGQPIEKMALDIRAGYDLAAAAGAPVVRSVVPVGEAWNRAIKIGLADPNPYDGISAGQIDLWTTDNYHASAFGYYLEALMIFGDVTGLDPRSLGKEERAAVELGFSPEQTTALQQVAFDELSATKGRSPLIPFLPSAGSTASSR